jgi:hypothetical protein
VRFRLVAATVAVASLTLAGCGGSPDVAPKAAASNPATQSSTAPSSTTSTEIPQAVRDTIFDQYVTNNGLTAHGDVSTLEAGAHTICAAYANGQGFIEVIQALVQGGWSAYQAGQMNGASVTAYCPQYADRAMLR